MEPGNDPYSRLTALALTLPVAPRPVANYVPRPYRGGTSVEDAYAHARRTSLNLIAVMDMALGDLRRVKRIVKVLGMVNAAPDFKDHPKVINGCSDLFVEVFGNAGRHARSAVGMGSLPNGMTVEVEVIVEINP